MANIAFIGLGNMGAPMAANLLQAGHQVCVFDLLPEIVDSLVSLGAASAATATLAAAGKDFVISMLPSGKHVEAVFLAEQGVLSVLSKDTVIMDCSTIDVATAQKVAAAAKSLDVLMMDCPVSGGVAAAKAGTLSFMCGGSAQAFEKVQPILAAMAKHVFHAGDNGAGQIAKICNNMLLAVHMIGTSEALQLGVDNGMNPKVLSDIMLASSGRNWSLEVYNPYPNVDQSTPASNNYEPGFMVNLMCKDLGLALEAAENSDSETPMGALAQKLYRLHAERGNGERDFSSILELLKSY